jgi:hypothetical protein
MKVFKNLFGGHGAQLMPHKHHDDHGFTGSSLKIDDAIPSSTLSVELQLVLTKFKSFLLL